MKFTGKHLCQSLFFNKVAGFSTLQEASLQKTSRLEACNFVKKETLAQVFSCEFCEIFKSTVFTEQHWKTASASTPSENRIVSWN